MTNSQILAIVQSLTIDKVDFDNLNREESSDVLYIVNQAYRTILLEVENLRVRLSSPDYPAEDIRRWIQQGGFDLHHLARNKAHLPPRVCLNRQSLLFSLSKNLPNLIPQY